MFIKSIMANDSTDCNDSIIENGIPHIALDEQHRVMIDFLK